MQEKNCRHSGVYRNSEEPGSATRNTNFELLVHLPRDENGAGACEEVHWDPLLEAEVSAPGARVLHCLQNWLPEVFFPLRL